MAPSLYPTLSPLYAGPSPFLYPTSAPSSAAPSSSPVIYSPDHIPVCDPAPFEPMLITPYPHSQSDIYYASEQDAVYPLHPSSGSSWPAEPTKEKPSPRDRYYGRNSSTIQHPLSIHQYSSADYPAKTANTSYAPSDVPIIINSPRPLRSPLATHIEAASSGYTDSIPDEWERTVAPLSSSLYPHPLPQSHSGGLPQAQYPTSRVRQDDLAIYTAFTSYRPPQHLSSPQSCPFDLQSLYSGNSSTDGSGPSSHHGTPAPMQALPLPTPHPYSHSLGMTYRDETLPQEGFMRSAELSPTEFSVLSLSPQQEYSHGGDPRFITGTLENVCHTIDRSCLIDDPEQPVYAVGHHKTIQLQRYPSDGNLKLGLDIDIKPSIHRNSLDVDDDVDAEGDFDHGDDVEPDLDKDTDDDPRDGDFVLRHRGRSSSSASTAHVTPPPARNLRPRSASNSSPTRFSPYQYPPPQSSTSARSTRSRRVTAAAASSSPTEPTSPFPSSQPEQSHQSSPPGSRRRNRPTTPLPIPIPVPHLTKKSRGRGVPTIATLELSGRGRGGQTFSEEDYTESGKRRNGTRSYTCKVPGCGKCFARGEHLKRHVRSIHTYEKPHKCPYPGCGKDFSRHDNLGQHMRVHKDYVPRRDSRAYRA